MNRKRILPLVLAALLTASVSFVGCGNNDGNTTTNDGKNTVEDVGKNATDATKDSGENLKNATNNLWDNVTDTTMDLGANDVKEQLKEKGLKLTEEDTKTNYFSVEGKTYNLNGDKIFIYEYEKNNTDKLKEDINKISADAKTINGKAVNWNKTPHLYKKGRTVVIYDGEDSDTLTTLKEVLGNPVVG